MTSSFFDFMMSMPLEPFVAPEPKPKFSVLDAMKEKLFQSFHIPSHLLATSVDCGGSNSPRSDVNNQLFENQQKRSAERVRAAIENTLFQPMGELSTFATSTADFSVKKLLELQKQLSSRPTPMPSASLRLVGCPLLGSTKQFRFPKSKKKRIRKKWSKRRENYRFVPDSAYYLVGDEIHAHPATLEKLKKAISNHQEAIPSSYDIVKNTIS